MWRVQCKADKDSQSWATLASYDNEVSAIDHATRVAADCVTVIVTDPEGSVIWSN